MKLIELDKNNIIIDTLLDGGTSYKFSFNENVSFKWTDFKNKKLVNKVTKEVSEYKDIVSMKPAKGSEIYFFPENYAGSLYNSNELYNINNWKFEDDDVLKSVNRDEKITELENKINRLTVIFDNYMKVSGTVASGLEAMGKSLRDIQAEYQKLTLERPTTASIKPVTVEPVQISMATTTATAIPNMNIMGSNPLTSGTVTNYTHTHTQNPLTMGGAQNSFVKTY